MDRLPNLLRNFSRFGPRRAATTPVLAIVALVATCCGCGSAPSAQELSAKAELTKLGALLVMDPQRAHVSGVNLATVQSPESLASAVKLLPALVKLSSLNADGTALNDEQAAVIGQLTTLGDLVLNHTRVTDAGVAKLQALRGLQSLHLTGTGITNASLPVLGKLPALTVLDLSETKVTGGFAALSGSSKLQWLVVRGLKLDGAALSEIGQNSGLHRISLTAGNCPPEALTALQQQHSQLTIDRQ